jgi:uncharacterized protein (TIGR02145 family)
MMKLFLKILCCFVFSINLLSGQVVISHYQDEEVHPSAMLEVASENKGVLFPRMTAVNRNAIPNPSEGLIVFCTDCGDLGVMQMFNGTQWVDLYLQPASGENLPPQAINLNVMGVPLIGSTLSAKYDYFDTENNPEGNSIVNWFLAEDSLGNSMYSVSTNSHTYVVKEADLGKFIGFSVQPGAVAGTQMGEEVWLEKFVGPISDYEDCELELEITGQPIVGSTLNAVHDCYLMADSIVYSWYKTFNIEGLNKTLIQSSTINQYEILAADFNHILMAEVAFYLDGNLVGLSSELLDYPVFFEMTCGSMRYTSEVNIGKMIHSSQPQTNNDTIEKYCYNNVEDNCIQYGGLYQWNETMQYVASSASVPSNVRGICPEGYHLPSDGEFANLEYCIETEFMPLGSTTLFTFQTSFNSRGTTLGFKMKEVSPVWNGENTSGFSALPGGRFNAGQFRSIKSQMYLWTATQSSALYAINRLLLSNSNGMSRQQIHKDSAHSIRCFKD